MTRVQIPVDRRSLQAVRLPGAAACLAAVALLASPAVPQAGAQLPAADSTPAAVAGPLASELDQLAQTPAVPSNVSAVLGLLSSELNSSTPPTPAAVSAVLAQLAGTPGLATPVADALTTLAGPAASPDALSGALAGLIDQLAATPGVPATTAAQLGQLGDALTGASPPTTAQAAADLGQLASVPGTPAGLGQELNGLAGVAGAGSSGAPGATGGSGSGNSGGTASSGGTGSAGLPGFAGSNPFAPGPNPSTGATSTHKVTASASAYGSVIVSAKFNAKRGSVAVVVMCNAAKTSCNTAVAVYRGNKLAGRAVAKTIHARKRATYSVHLSRTSVASITKRSTTLRTVAVSNTPYGRTNSTRLVRVAHQEKHKA